MQDLIIVGAGTNARHAYAFIKDYNLYNVIGFAVNSEYRRSETFEDNLPIFTLEHLHEYADMNNTKVFVALLWNRLNEDRKQLYEYLSREGFSFANLISPKSSIRGEIGNNCWIHDYTVIQNNTTIGNNVAMMAYSMVGANTMISNHCFLGAKSTVAGGCSIGEQTFVGINCTVFDGTSVGKKCILGACTSVKRNVPDYSLYKSSSDIVIKRYDETSIEEKLLYKKNVR